MSIGYCPTCQASPIIGDDYCPTCHRTGRADAWVKSLPEYKPDAFGTRLSADDVNRLGDTIADLRTEVERLRAALTALLSGDVGRQTLAKLLREIAGAPHCKGNLFVRDELRRKADELEGKK